MTDQLTNPFELVKDKEAVEASVEDPKLVETSALSNEDASKCPIKDCRTPMRVMGTQVGPVYVCNEHRVAQPLPNGLL